MAIRLKDKLKLSDGLNTTSSIDAGTMDLSGVLTLSKSNGSLIATTNTTDAFGYNATAGKGHYIKGTGSTYVYGGGTFYDGSTTHTLLHDGSTISTDQISNLSGTNTGDQVLPTDFVSAASGGTFANAVNIADIIDGDFTALRLMNQKTYGSGTGTNEKVRFVMGISESGYAYSAREGFAIRLSKEFDVDMEVLMDDQTLTNPDEMRIKARELQLDARDSNRTGSQVFDSGQKRAASLNVNEMDAMSKVRAGL